MKIALLSAAQIEQKLKRMAYEILEQNEGQQDIVLVGIKQGGAIMAENLAAILKEICKQNIEVISLSVNKRSPLEDDISIGLPLDGKSVILVDDVANSGKTLLYALRPILRYEPSKIKVLVLVDRKHKSYPITPDIIGHSVSTTLQDRIVVTYDDKKLTGAYLE